MNNSYMAMKSPWLSIAFPIALFLSLGGSLAAQTKADANAFTLTSPAFVDGGTLPAKYTCDGKRASPPLEWSNAPSGTQSFAITMHHIPGPGDKHVYLVVYNIPADVHALPENSKDIGTFGINTVNGQQEYTPPCSKGPGPKKYTMTVYALSAASKIEKPASAVTMDILLAAIKNITLAKAEMSVTYSRPDSAMASEHGAPPGGQVGGQAPDGAGQDNPAPPAKRENPPRRGGREQEALDQLQLTDDQKTKAAPIMDDFQEKQRALRDDLMSKLKAILTDKQFQQFETSFRRPPRPPEQNGGDGNNPPRDQGGPQ